jgi:hypothetical protein
MMDDCTVRADCIGQGGTGAQTGSAQWLQAMERLMTPTREGHDHLHAKRSVCLLQPVLKDAGGAAGLAADT